MFFSPRIGSYDSSIILVLIGGQMATRKYAVLLEAAEEGGFIVKSTELPVASQGQTKDEALRNIKEAIEGYLEVKAQLLKRKVKVEKAEVAVEAPSALLAENC
jgi:predicted RNase H-like HicB family nuclease